MLFFFVLCVFQFSFGQYKDQDVEIVNHEVQSNESVRALSKKYSVDPADIYKLNRFAVDGISEGMVLQIPVRKKESSSKQEEQSTNSLQESASVVDDAEEEKKIAIEAKKTAKKEPSVSIVNSTKESETKEKVEEFIKHKVEPKETLYGLSKKYNVSVDEIKQKNEAVLQNGLQIGQILIIRKIN